jgi:hypothetical protein
LHVRGTQIVLHALVTHFGMTRPKCPAPPCFRPRLGHLIRQDDAKGGILVGKVAIALIASWFAVGLVTIGYLIHAAA